MTDQDALLAAALRDRRRIILVFSAVLAIVAISLTTGWVLAWNGRDAWRDQAMTWQERYVQLYDEFTVETGDEPSAPEPAEVAKTAPDPVPGPPGPVGPRGADGKGEPGPPGADGLPGADSLIPGPAGKDGKDGVSVAGPQGPAGESIVGPQGATGPAGEDGKDSTVPGPQGVGIQTVTCQENGDWIFTLTDQTTITVPGPCRVDPIIEGATP